MTNGNDLMHSFVNTETEVGNYKGLTKREYFTAMAMQAICTNSHPVDMNTVLEIPGNVAKWSVVFADALIAELNKHQ